MIPRDDRCYFCKSLAVEVRRVSVDGEPDEEGGMMAIYADVPLCEEHCMEQDEEMGGK